MLCFQTLCCLCRTAHLVHRSLCPCLCSSSPDSVLYFQTSQLDSANAQLHLSHPVCHIICTPALVLYILIRTPRDSFVMSSSPDSICTLQSTRPVLYPPSAIPSAVHPSYFIHCSHTTCFIMHGLFPIPCVLVTVLVPFFFIFLTPQSVTMLHSACSLLYTSWVSHHVSLSSLLYCDSPHVILHAVIPIHHSPSPPTILHIFTPRSILPST